MATAAAVAAPPPPVASTIRSPSLSSPLSSPTRTSSSPTTASRAAHRHHNRRRRRHRDTSRPICPPTTPGITRHQRPQASQWTLQIQQLQRALARRRSTRAATATGSRPTTTPCSATRRAALTFDP